MTSTDPLRVVLLTSVWRRVSLTEIVLRAYRDMRESLQPNLDLVLLAVGSEGAASRSLCERYGFHYLEAPNRPLSSKWNAGVRHSRCFEPDGLIIVGSDDLLTPGAFPTLAGKLGEGHQFLGLEDLFFFHIPTGRLGYWPGYGIEDPDRQGEPIGCGRCFGRELLDATDWSLWPEEPTFDSLLDEATLRYLGERGFSPRSWTMRELGIKAVDIKLGPNITSFESYRFQHFRTGNEVKEFFSEWISEAEFAELVSLGRAPAGMES